MPTPRRLAPPAAGCALALSLVAAWLSLARMPGPLGALVTSSDFGAPAALYRDVVTDGYAVSQYQFSAATFALPDQAAYFAARTVTGSAAPAMPLWVGIAVCLWAGCLAWAGAELAPARKREAASAVIGLAAAYLAANAAYGFPHPFNDLLLPVWHNGALALSMIGVALTARLARAGSGRAALPWSVGVALVTALGLFSDRFVGFYFALPAAAALVVWWRRGQITARRLALWLAACGAGGVGGLVLLKLFQGAGDPISNYWKSPEFDQLAERALLLAYVIGSELAGGNLLLVGAAGWYAHALGTQFARRPADPALAFLRAMSAVMLAAVALVFLLSATADAALANLDYVEFSRYFVGPVGTAFLGWAVWLAARPRLVLAAALVGLVAAGGAALGIAWHTAGAERPGDLWYPDKVRFVDEACRARGLTQGLAGYSDAKALTLHSRAGVAVRQVRPDSSAVAGFTAFAWLSGSGGYTVAPTSQGGGPTAFEFVVTGRTPGELSESAVVAKLGEPAERVPAGQLTLLVYNRPGDWRVRDFGRADLQLLNAAAERGAFPVVYPGRAMLAPKEIGVDDADEPTGPRVADESHSTSGIAAFGPYVRATRTGWYRVSFDLSASGPPGGPGGTLGYADVVWTAADGTGGEVLACVALADGAGPAVPLDFRVGPEQLGGSLQFRLSFEGRGRIELRSVKYERRTHK